MHVTGKDAVIARRAKARCTNRWLSKIGAATCLTLALVGCGGGGGDGGGSESLADQAMSAVLDFLSGGAFKDLDSLVVALQGDSLVINDFGTSELGTNPGLLPTGSALVSGIACGPTSCTGQVLVPTISNGTLTSFGRETGTLTQQGTDSFVISSPSLGEKTFTRTTATPSTPSTPSTAPTPGTVASALNKDSTCDQWWSALRGHSFKWVGGATSGMSSVSSADGAVPVPDGTLTFSEVVSGGVTTMRWAIDAPPMPRPGQLSDYDWYPSRHGDVSLADKWPSLGVCRIMLQFDPNQFMGLGNWTLFDSYITWGYTLSGGNLRLILSPDNPDAGWWDLQAVN